MMPGWAAVPSPAAKRHRLVYDVKQGNFNDLPGTLMREEGDPRSEDPAVNEAYIYSGTTYNFYKKVFQRNSLDDRGMSLISSAHLGRNLNNAFWTGEQMCYGDGDAASSSDSPSRWTSSDTNSRTVSSRTPVTWSMRTNPGRSTNTSPTCSAAW